MPVAGIDVGSSTAKAVILEDDQIIASSILPVTSNVTKVAHEVMKKALGEAELSMKDLACVVSTGYGRNAVSFAHKVITGIICHAKGVHFWIPKVGTIIDIGAQDSKVIRVGGHGDVTNFVMKDKCAAGSGRFLELMAHTLGVGIEDMGPLSLKSHGPSQISSTCTLFAESEVVSLRAEGKTLEDLIAGIHRAIAKRVFMMGSSLRYEKEIVFTGGVAKNSGVRKALEAVCGGEILVPQDPQMTGALGSAMIALSESVK